MLSKQTKQNNLLYDRHIAEGSLHLVHKLRGLSLRNPTSERGFILEFYGVPQCPKKQCVKQRVNTKSTMGQLVAITYAWVLLKLSIRQACMKTLHVKPF